MIGDIVFVRHVFGLETLIPLVMVTAVLMITHIKIVASGDEGWKEGEDEGDFE